MSKRARHCLPLLQFPTILSLLDKTLGNEFQTNDIIDEMNYHVEASVPGSFLRLLINESN